MKGLVKFWVVAACLCYGTFAFADGLTKLPYSYIQLNYINSDFDDIDVDADGFGIDASYDMGGNIFISGSYGSGETDKFVVLGVNGSIETTEYTVGIGYHHAITPTVDLVPSVAVVNGEIEGKGGFSGADDSDTGWSANLALRAMVTPQVEVTGDVDYADVFSDDSTSFGVKAVWYPVNQFGVGVGYDISDDTKTLGVGIRAFF